MDYIFNFSRYEELRQAVFDLKRDNLDTDSLFEEAQDLFDSWWSTTHNTGAAGRSTQVTAGSSIYRSVHAGTGHLAHRSSGPHRGRPPPPQPRAPHRPLARGSAPHRPAPPPPLSGNVALLDPV